MKTLCILFVIFLLFQTHLPAQLIQEEWVSRYTRRFWDLPRYLCSRDRSSHGVFSSRSPMMRLRAGHIAIV